MNTVVAPWSEVRSIISFEKITWTVGNPTTAAATHSGKAWSLQFRIGCGKWKTSSFNNFKKKLTSSFYSFFVPDSCRRDDTKSAFGAQEQWGQIVTCRALKNCKLTIIFAQFGFQPTLLGLLPLPAVWTTSPSARTTFGLFLILYFWSDSRTSRFRQFSFIVP